MSDDDKTLHQQVFQEAFERGDMRDLMREALDDWLTRQFAQFGRWTLGGMLAAAFAGAIYLALTGMGWIHK